MTRSLRSYLDDERMPIYTPEIVLAKQRGLLPRIVDCLFVAYVGGGLTGVSPGMKERYETTKGIVESHNGFAYVPHINGTDPVKNPEVMPNDVRDIDEFWAVNAADFQIVWLDPAADGVGIEGGWGEYREIPLVAMSPQEKRISRLRKGLRNYHTELRYEDLSDAYTKLDDLMTGLETWSRAKPVKYYFDKRKYVRRLANQLENLPANLAPERIVDLATETEALVRKFSLQQA